MAQQGQKLRSALNVDPRASRQAAAGQARQLPASTFRKVTAPTPRNVAPLPRTQPGVKPGQNVGARPTPFDVIGRPEIAPEAGRIDNRIGIGQFEQNQFNRQIPQALMPGQEQPIYDSPARPNQYGQFPVQALPVSQVPQQPSFFQNPAVNREFGQYQPGQVGIGSFMQNQFQPQLPSPATSAASGMLAGPIMGTAPQSPAMNQAAQIAQGGMTGMGSTFRR